MRRLVKRGQRERQEGLSSRSRPLGEVSIPLPAALPDHGLLNVAWRGDNLILVERIAGKIVIRQRRAEYSCFIDSSVSDEVKRKIRNHRAVAGMKEEGKWTRIYWRSRRLREELCTALEEDGLQTYEGDVNPIRRYMTDNAPKLAVPRTCFLDIETDSRVPVKLAAQGRARILCWTVIGLDGLIKVGVLEDDTNDAERKLLQRLFMILESYDQVCAWNGDRFDFPALSARTMARGVRVNLDRWLFLDQLELFKRSNMMAAESGEEKASYALQAIAMELLKVGKDDFDASKTYEEWKAGGERRARLVRYNVKDAQLQLGIEQKTGYVALLATLAETCNVFADSRGMNPTIQAEGLLLKIGADRDTRFPTRYPSWNFNPFKGAFVMEPQAVGIVKNVHVGDFASLYPSIIVTWNMSPETIVTGEEEDDLNVAWAEGAAPLEDCYSMAPGTGKFFRTEVEGILPHAVKEVMRLRKYWNDLKATLPPGTDEWTNANRKATAYKIAANSLYGVVGSPLSRFFCRDVAESVTQAGAWLIQETMKASADRSMNGIYGDTDSNFIMGCSRQEFEEFVAWCNDELYPLILSQQGCKVNLIKLAYEKEFERVIFTAAKKYCGRYAHFKGTPASEDSKPEVKGLEYKRGDAIRLARQFQAEVVDWLMGGGIVRPKRVEECVEDPFFFEEVIERWKRRILEEPLLFADVAVRKTLQKELDGYARKRKNDGSWARQAPHIELARRLSGQGEDVSEGTKISYFIYDASDKKNVEYRVESEWDGGCDRFELWERLVWPATQRLLAAAFPGTSWAHHTKVRPRQAKARKHGSKAVTP